MAAANAEASDPGVFKRRSPIWRTLLAAGARFVPMADAAVAAAFGDDVKAERAAFLRLGLIDVSPLPRIGFKGAGTSAWSARQGLAIGDASNRAYPCGEGLLAVRLAPGEILILGDCSGEDSALRRLEDACTAEDKVFPVPRREGTFWFLVSGEQAPAMFAKLCGVDLRPHRFANGAVAQTSVARINTVVVRDDVAGVLCYHLLGDVASAGSMWSYLTDAMTEFDGRPVGIDVATGNGSSPRRQAR